MVDPYAAAWREANERDRAADGPLWVVLGDSAAQGVGAGSHDAGYVGQVRAALTDRDATPWRVLNLSRSGARAADVLAEQLPALTALDAAPDLVTCLVGGNDLLRTPVRRLREELRLIMAGLPPGAVIGTLPQGLAAWRARQVNDVIRAEAPGHDLRVADLWATTGPPWQGKYARDNFHPNDRGYEDWTRAVLGALEQPVPQ